MTALNTCIPIVLLLLGVSNLNFSLNHVAVGRWGVVTNSTTIVFVKPKKVGGSTVAGVVRRIGAHYNISGYDKGLEQTHSMVCDEQGAILADHMTYASLVAELKLHCRHQPNRNLFVLAWVRNPFDRCLSWYYHKHVTRDHETPTLSNKIAVCGAEGMGDHFQEVFSTDQVLSPSKTLECFDFVGVAERFDESMVVLMERLGLAMSDILYLSVKNSSVAQPTGHQDVENHNVMVRHPPLSEEPIELQRIPQTTAWKKRHAWSLQFVKLAHQALDRHIAYIGVAVFQQRLSLYKALLARAKTECGASLKDADKVCYYNVSANIEVCVYKENIMI